MLKNLYSRSNVVSSRVRRRLIYIHIARNNLVFMTLVSQLWQTQGKTFADDRTLCSKSKVPYFRKNNKLHEGHRTLNNSKSGGLRVYTEGLHAGCLHFGGLLFQDKDLEFSGAHSGNLHLCRLHFKALLS